MSEKEAGMNMESLVKLVLNNRRSLLMVVIISILVSYAGSFLMKPQYKSTLILFPTSQNSISESIVRGGEGFLDFGDEVQVEKMLQVLNSNGIRDQIIKKYDLYTHYNIDREEKNARTKVIKEYKSKVHFKRNEFMSVEVVVYDIEPIVAANIANSVGELLDSVQNRIQKERAIIGLEILSNKLMELNNSIELLEDSLVKFHSLGILDFTSQVEVYSEYHAKAVSEGKTNAADILKKKLDAIASNGTYFMALEEKLNSLKDLREDVEVQYFIVKIDAEEDFTHKFVVNRAEKAEVKSKPNRWLIVFVSTFSVLVLSLLILTIQERKQL